MRTKSNSTGQADVIGRDSATAPNPTEHAKRTVSFQLTAEEYGVFDHAIRTFFAGVYHTEGGSTRQLDIAERARQLLRRDTEDLLRRVPATRPNPNVSPTDPNTVDESGTGKIIPFMPVRAKRGWSIPELDTNGVTAGPSKGSTPPAKDHTLNLPVPESLWKWFEAYRQRIARSNFANRENWKNAPILTSLDIGIPPKWDDRWSRPLNSRCNSLPSKKGIIHRIRKLAKTETLVSVPVELTPVFWARIHERADFHGISPVDLCLSCIGYHAYLERGYQEREKPRSPFENFERHLAKESATQSAGGGQ